MDNYKNKTKPELIVEIERLQKLNNNLKVKNSREVSVEKTENYYNSENELIRQKEMFELVINSAPARIFWKDLNSVYLGCNTAFAKAAGAKKVENIIGKTDSDLIWGKEAKKYIDDDQKVLKTGISKLNYEEDYTIPNGDKVWWKTNKIPLKDNNEKVIGILGTSEDITDRKQAEELILKNKNRLNYALNTIETGAWELDLINLDSWRSFNHDKIFGYSEPLFEWTYDMFLEHVLPEDREFVNEKFQKAIATKTDWNFECRINRKDGAVRWISGNGNQELNKNKEATKMFGIVQDITTRKLAEEKLKDSEEKYKALYENAPLSYQSLNEDGTFKDINPRWLETLGYERNEVIGKNYADFLHPDWAAHFEKNFPAFKKRGYVNDVQYKLRHKKGHYIYISFEGCIGYNTDGSFRQTYCVFQDITERKLAEENLKISEEKFRSIIEQAGDALFLSDFEGNILMVNKNACKMLGYDQNELLKMKVGDLDTEYIDLEIQERLWNTLVVGQAQTIVTNYKHKNGEIIPVEIRFALYENDGDKNILGFARDITERKQGEKAIKLSEEKFAKAFKVSPYMVSLSSMDGLVVEVNDKVFETFGYTRDEFIGQNTTELSLWVNLNQRSNFVNFLNEDGTLHEMDVQFRKKSGEIGDFLLSASIIEVNDNKLLMSIIHDITDKKQAEKDLKDSELKFRRFIEGNPLPHAYIDKDGFFVFRNKQFIEIFGYTEADISNMNDWWEKAYPDEQYRQWVTQGWEKAIAKASETKTVIKSEEYQVTCKDGNVRYIIISGVTFGEEVLGSFIDITDRKIAEEELIKLNQVLKETGKMAKIGGWEFDVETGDGTWTEEVACIHDLEPGEPTNMEKGVSFYTADSRKQIDLAIKTAIEKAQAYDLELEMITAKGNDKWIRTIGEPTLKEGKVIRVHGSFQDITDRKLAEQELRKLNDALEAAQQMANVGYWSYNIEIESSIWSNQMYVVFGQTNENGVIPYTSHKNFIHHEDWELFDNAMQACLKGDAYNIVSRVDFADGSQHFVQTQGFPRFNDKNEIIEIFGTSQDVTELKKAEDELNKHREQLEELVKERTKNLDEKNRELERMNKLFVGREMRMVELKKKIKKLESE